MLCDALLLARRRDKEFACCLMVSHVQLALAGMYAEACRRQAIAASKKKNGSKGAYNHIVVLWLADTSEASHPICTEVTF
jgi:hypothetical protein